MWNKKEKGRGKMELLCYTREPMETAIYDEKLAYSMHLAYRAEDGSFQTLNHNSGVWFAKATQNPDGTLNAKSLKHPWIFRTAEGDFAVAAVRTEADGKTDESVKGQVMIARTPDFLTYRETGWVCLENGREIQKVACVYEEEKECYLFRWMSEGKWKEGRLQELSGVVKEVLQSSDIPEEIRNPEISGAVPGNTLEIPDDAGRYLVRRLTVPRHVRTRIKERTEISSREELEKLKAEVLYSDGTCEERTVDWDLSAVDFETGGTFRIRGTVHQDWYEFPIAVNRADPCIGKWNGRYYFMATNDADHEHTMLIRSAETIPELVNAEDSVILNDRMYPHLGNLLWAPELHRIKDRLYIFHAGTPQRFEEEQSHVMALREGGDPMKAEDWEMPVRVVRKDGSPLMTNGITLDMTCFEVKDSWYAVWSQRQLQPVDQGAWLYIAKLDPEQPWRLTTDPVCISMPEYGWANNHTFVDEGPFVLTTEGRVILTFSSAAVDSTYVVGLLCADPDADLLDPESWKKWNYPILTSRSVPGEYGPGHNAYIQDENGLVWNTYHARPGVDGPRSSGIRRVHFDPEGWPVLDMSRKEDLDPEISTVFLELTVKAKRK